jgi:aminoglycoside phosphotransferase (APT) family kinase protein
VVAVFDFKSVAPGDPVEDFVPTADHGLESPIFTVFVAGYLERGRLDPDAPQRFAFYQLEHCLDVLGWAYQADRGVVRAGAAADRGGAGRCPAAAGLMRQWARPFRATSRAGKMGHARGTEP